MKKKKIVKKLSSSQLKKKTKNSKTTKVKSKKLALPTKKKSGQALKKVKVEKKVKKNKSPKTKFTSRQPIKVNASEVFLFTEDNVRVYKQQASTTQIKETEIWQSNTKVYQSEQKIDQTNNEVANEGGQLISIKKTTSELNSPYVVDLKNQGYYRQRVLANLSSKPSFEEKIFAWDKRIQNVKTNFITPEIKQYKLRSAYNIDHQPPRWWLRLWRRSNGALSGLYQLLISKFSSWGENQTEIILQRAANKLSDNQTDYLDVTTTKPTKHLSFLPTDVLVSLRLFVLLALVLIVPLQGYTYYHDLKTQRAMVLGATSTIYEDFQEGFSAFEKLDFSAAENRFNQAQTNLAMVNNILDKYPAWLISVAKVIPNFGGEVSNGLILTSAGNKMAELGIYLTDLFKNLETNGSNNIAILQSLHLGLVQAEASLSDIQNLLAKVEPASLPADYQSQFQQLNDLLPAANAVFQNAAEISLFASDWLGAKEPQRYLLIFQNNNELRPSGGFIGSIAEVDIKNGKIQNFYLPPGGVYDLQGNLKTLLASPKPLWLLNANWQLQDSNWFFDFPTTAQKVMWFYEKSGGPTVDGVVAVNSQILPKLLAITGPIDLPEFNLKLDANNVINELQQEVEVNYNRENNQPKKVLAALLPILIQKLEALPPQDFFNIFSLVHNSLQVRDIQLYHQQPDLQAKIKHFGFGGEVQNADYDYLAVVDTNIGGGKTDQVISSQVLLTTNINANGEVINTLKIIKQHNGDLADYFTGHTYQDYLRVYVPYGSKLLTATGFNPPPADQFNQPAAGYTEDKFLPAIETNEQYDLESGTRITDEFGKTVFANWLSLQPGQQVEVSLSYILPNKIVFKKQNQDNYFINILDSFLAKVGLAQPDTDEVGIYTLFLQKQSGQPSFSFSQEIIFPNIWEALVSKLLKDNTAQRDNHIYYQNATAVDQLWGVIFKN